MGSRRKGSAGMGLGVFGRRSRVRRGREGMEVTAIVVDEWAGGGVTQDRDMRMARRGSRNSTPGQGEGITGVADAVGGIGDDLRRE